MNRAVVDALTDCVLQALARREPVPPAAMALLLDRYAETGREDVREALEAALAHAFDQAAVESDLARRGEWLELFLLAGQLSEDGRVRDACDTLAGDLAREWPGHGSIASAMRTIEPCLTYGLLQPGIDELERVVGASYKPGCGLAPSAGGPPGARRGLDDHVWAASALLTAYSATGRLPYGMLAEELMQFARRTWWNDARGSWNPDPTPGPDIFAVSCHGARVLCRLGALHRDPGYRQAALIADCDYSADAGRVLHALASEYRAHGVAAAIYALATLEWLALPPNLQ